MKHIIPLFCLILISCGATDERPIDKRVDINRVLVYDKMEEAQTASQLSGKPIFVIFDSPVVGCCGKTTMAVFETFRKSDIITDKYEVLYLQLDDKTKVNSKKKIHLNGESTRVKTIGDENFRLMMEMFDFVHSYLYAILDDELTVIKEPIGFFSSEESVVDYLLN